MSGDNGNPLAEAAKKSFAASFGAVLQIVPDEGKPLWIDGRAAPPNISDAAPKDAETACVLCSRRDSLVRAFANNRAFESAYVSGRIAVSGDMSVMARLELGPKK
jgi:hypothetical protein